MLFQLAFIIHNNTFKLLSVNSSVVSWFVLWPYNACPAIHLKYFTSIVDVLLSCNSSQVFHLHCRCASVLQFISNISPPLSMCFCPAIHLKYFTSIVDVLLSCNSSQGFHLHCRCASVLQFISRISPPLSICFCPAIHLKYFTSIVDVLLFCNSHTIRMLVPPLPNTVSTFSYYPFFKSASSFSVYIGIFIAYFTQSCYLNTIQYIPRSSIKMLTCYSFSFFFIEQVF